MTGGFIAGACTFVLFLFCRSRQPHTSSAKMISTIGTAIAMAIIIVFEVLLRIGSGDGTAVFVVVVAAALRVAVVENPIAPPVAVATTEVPDTRDVMMDVAARVGLVDR